MIWLKIKKFFGRNTKTTIVADGGSSVCCASRDIVIDSQGNNSGIISAINDGEISSFSKTVISGENHGICIKTDINGKEIVMIDGEKVEVPEERIRSVQIINGQVVINGWVYKNGEWVKK